MPPSSLQLFRGFLTERLTAAAVEIFGEVEKIVELYCDENNRLQKALDTLFNSEVKLHRIDRAAPPAASTTDIFEQEQRYRLDSLGPNQPAIKEEPEDCMVDPGDKIFQGPEIADSKDFIVTTVCKSDYTEQDSNVPQIPPIDHLPDTEFHSESTLSPIAAHGTADIEPAIFRDLQRSTHHPPLSKASKNKRRKYLQCQDCGKKWKKKSGKLGSTKRIRKRPLQKTILEIPRRKQFKSLTNELPDTKSLMLGLAEAFKDIPDAEKPLIAKTGFSDNMELVDSVYGKVPKGCPLSYQCPVPSVLDYSPHENAPPTPSLPLVSHKLEPATSLPHLSGKELEHLKSLEITWDAAHSLELFTRQVENSEALDAMRKSRLTSRFKEICQLQAGKSHGEHLVVKIQKEISDSKLVKMEKVQRPEALREYCKQAFVNWSACGLVVHPDAPWLGAVPNGLVYDPTENPKCKGRCW
ncbi:uncharacterized protein LOC130107524 isoform X2 [Lampris incognitus]|uniref:uncharacterized protein LOC130107524 isoform X2 n=1 Tax=Lampris incognitus TaxID=2546036 RepID=UPI0024B58CE4|nr:uncharacterized protein LOC130107524 isoform X2 [Lampris incognitus]